MPLLADLVKIPIKSIAPKSSWDLHPFLSSSPNEYQLSSVAAMGLVLPPMVVEKITEGGDTEYILLSTRQWVKAYQNTFPEETTIAALVLSSKLKQEEVLQYLLHYKLTTYNFSRMEKAYFFSHCLDCMLINDVAKTFLPQLNEKAQAHTINKYVSLTKLELPLQNSVHSEQLPMKVALELLTLPVEDRIKLHTLFEQLELGGGKQKRLLVLCKDLAGRQNINITTLLNEECYTDILEHQEMNRPQKGASLLSCLYKQLFPESNKAEEDFDKRIKRMELPPSCTTTHSPAFEKDEVILSITFPTLTAMEEQITKIKKTF